MSQNAENIESGVSCGQY